jgi:LacI family transcriptional regulator
MWKLAQDGVDVPGRVSLIGYDGIRIGQMAYPRLTTYAQDTARIAGEAVRLLAEAIEQPEAHCPGHVKVEGRLIEGGTVSELSR